MKHEATVQFKSSGSGGVKLSMMGAIAQAKETVGAMTSLQVDSIARCTKSPEGDWEIAVDVIESVARMGDNDLLATYEVQIDKDGEMVNFNRTRRYHREDRDQQ